MTQLKSFETHLKPMLAKKQEKPFSDPEWLFEVKLDGYRIIADFRGGNTRLLSRNGLNYSTRNIRPIIKILNTMDDDVILDGEMVVLDEEGKPDFDALQNASRQSPPLWFIMSLMYCIIKTGHCSTSLL